MDGNGSPRSDVGACSELGNFWVSKDEAERFCSIFPPKQEEAKIVAFPWCNRQSQFALRSLLLSDIKLQMVSVPESCRKHFLVLYESYQKAKKKNGPVIWARAVLCREYLEKIADPDKEADIFEEMFAGEERGEFFRELCKDSKSHPRESLRLPLAPETVSVPKS
jgi:hypothetical protein